MVDFVGYISIGVYGEPSLDKKNMSISNDVWQDGMRILLDHSFGSVTAGGVIQQGMNGVSMTTFPLILYCSFARLNVEGLALLLDRGADIHARDWTGGTCLHACVHNTDIEMSKGGLENARSGLIYLIRRGADVFALEGRGISVSQKAYSRCFPGASSANGDLWDSVLADCSFDVEQFPRTYGRRRVAYRHGYTRESFEQLWKGQEHLCPYYYDEETLTSDSETGESTYDDLDDRSDEENHHYDSSSDSEDGGGYINELL
jgi:hypothetical protein